MPFGAILGPYRDKFLAEYWQKKPLLIRQAFPGGLDALDAEELAGLACLEGVDARLVLEHGAQPWQVKQGPFSEGDFGLLPPTHWTLLVQAVDRMVPAVSALRQHFRFLPNWRIDDVMISYAPDQGSVGPHTDNYDVFLLQGQGRRRWEISSEPLEHIELEAGLDMKILRNFQPDLSFELEPGDMLYLPPRVAHHGVALGESLTYSIGFRAPTQHDLMLSFAQFLQQHAGSDEELEFYSDPGLAKRQEPGQIEGREIEALWKLMEKGWQRKDLFKRWVGGFLTEPRSFHEAAEPELEPAQLFALIRRRGGCRRSEGVGFCYYLEADRLYFYAEGECVVLESSLAGWAAYLCREEVYAAEALGLDRLSPAAGAAFTHFWNQGFIRWEDDEDG